MLKALEIVGFKSFADKTLFKFPPGITVVVGPNGSGKSNIVDAIKWVLGEQSVKSLRGKEMADVIFNGSQSRKATNSAEITVTFDNRNHLLPIETPTVHITRRVYRSGEGEYLINRQPSRLRDIRELLSGTGMGTQAYSVIEQGKVDALLQSSPRDRRLIFEEAAGISLFKAKKVEALRRLERVEQNLLRLADIVDEVESRLRSVRMQAGKARRYKEYADRLQELRTQVGLADWRRLSDEIETFAAELASLAAERDGALAESEVHDAGLLRLDTRAAELNEGIRTAEARIAANRERIAGNETTLAHERRRADDLQQEISQHRRRLAQMSARAGDLKQQLADTVEAVEAAETHRRRIALDLVEQERLVAEMFAKLDAVRAEHKRREAEHMGRMKEAAELGNRISVWENRAQASQAAAEKSRRQMRETDAAFAALGGELAELQVKAGRMAEESRRCKDSLDEAREELEKCRRDKTAADRRRDDLRRRRIAVEQRITVLEELERRLEGLGAGVKQVISLSRKNAAVAAAEAFPDVCGLVADIIQVSVESASLVEVALGDAAQMVIVPGGGEMVEYLKAHASRFDGRVGFIWLDGPGSLVGYSRQDVFLELAREEAGLNETIDLEGRPGVLGRADRFVEVQPQYKELAARLLGRTWFVEKLAHAVELAKTAGSGCRFVTMAGELLETDGSITVGPRHASSGLISRRSELRALGAQNADVAHSCQEAEEACERLGRRIENCENRVRSEERLHLEAMEAAGESRRELTSLEERRNHLNSQLAAQKTELLAAENEHSHAVAEFEQAEKEAEKCKELLQNVEAELSGLAARAEELESQSQQRGRAATEAKVELAKSEERLQNLQTRLRQYEENRQERQRGLKENQEQMARCRRLFEQTQRNILQAESAIALLYLNKEQLAKETVSLMQARDSLGGERRELNSRSQQSRSKIRKLEEKIHAQELAMGDVRHRRDSLADRLREDYGIELAELELELSEEEQRRREEVQEEIEDLRKKINNLGSVNVEALAELEELESRYNTLSAQHKDLSDAKNELLRIIEKINTDSRRLFAETLDTVRGHFQTLFRDLFGGGQADIVMEDESDILESGIEIVARPPGKEPRSISLLSGGEKTMTCVALLLAIFRSRPSPFCVLDEVDAALDEANIDRFTKVLHGFLDWTQFIIVTHSKKTMTAASTIYGVTMQESGVSKQVSVRFEDVSEDGHINESALARSEEYMEEDDPDDSPVESEVAETVVAENDADDSAGQEDDVQAA